MQTRREMSRTGLTTKIIEAHHTHAFVCALCEVKLEQAHSALIYWYPKIKASFPSCHISWCFRDEKTQNEYFELGKTLARWPTSAHNSTFEGIPYSRALDLFELSFEGRALFRPGFYYQIAQHLKQIEAPIEWSGEWKKFKESNHYQLKENVPQE